MKVDSERISVIVTSYNNFNYLYDCLSSIIAQDYDNIEIVICDDSSIDFIKDGVDNFFAIYGNDNIKNIIINQNTQNLGTVKNVNSGLKSATGDYITMIAADDKYAGRDVFRTAVRHFGMLPGDALVLTTQVAMCDQFMNYQYPFMNERTLDTLMYKSTKDLLKLELIGSLLPAAGTFYKKEVFERFGLCDERYDLIEDYLLHLKLLKADVKFYYHNMLSVLHRAGGVSHGTEGASKSERFWKDCINVVENEVLPLLDIYLNEEEKKEVLETYKGTKNRYKAAVGETLSVLKIVDSKWPVFLDMSLNLVKFLAPRLKTVSLYLFIGAICLCIWPGLVNYTGIPLFGMEVSFTGSPIAGGIIALISVVLFSVVSIAEMGFKLLEYMRHFAKWPLSRYLELFYWHSTM